MATPDHGLYVYGLVPAGALSHLPQLPGGDGFDAVECVCEGDVCALVSKVEIEQFEEQPLREHLADMVWVEQTARRHQQVLDSVLGECTPLPMRLCTLYADEDGLRRMLESQQDDLSAALSELSGKLEWGVQVFAGLRASPGSETPSAAGSGTEYLQRRLAARQTTEQVAADLEGTCDRLYAELCTVAVAARLGAPQRPEVSNRDAAMVLNAFYLVPNEQRERFCSRFVELRDALSDPGIELKLTGPWPPYNFVAAAVGEAR